MSKKSSNFAALFNRVLPSTRKMATSAESCKDIKISPITMTKKRRQENLDYVLSIEQEMTSQGKRLSPAFYAVKRDLQKALGY
jgi:hypothetical protein